MSDEMFGLSNQIHAMNHYYNITIERASTSTVVYRQQYVNDILATLRSFQYNKYPYTTIEDIGHCNSELRFHIRWILSSSYTVEKITIVYQQKQNRIREVRIDNNIIFKYDLVNVNGELTLDQVTF
jgi:hypothetical protein